MSSAFINPLYNSDAPSVFRTKLYYYFLELIGIILPIAIGIMMILSPEYYSWLGNYTREATVSVFVIGFVHSLFFFANEFLHKNFIFSSARYIYVAFFLYIVFITGGINSSFIFLLFFPIAATAVYLDKNTTKNIGIVITVVLASMILFVPVNEITSALITKHVIQVLLMSIISYLIYSMVRETLKEKFEKDETTRRLSEMVQIDRIKSDFLSVAQHQLRTPLSGVKWALEILKSEKTIPADAMSIIDSGLERVKDSITIINQMLKTVEAAKGTLQIVPEPVDIVGVVQNILAELNFITLKKRIKLTFISPQSLLINADRNKIKAALINIIDNAIKYSPNATVNVNIVDSPVSVTIIVKDTGIGINSSDLPYIFERLHRGKNAVMVEPDESGVGLYTSKKMIELHGGTISVESVIDKGTTVTVVLPKN